MASTDDAPEPRYFGVHEGYVVDNRDPKARGRVRLCVPGINPLEGSAWAYPMGLLHGGGPQRGQHAPPEIGATVYVWFLGGDPQKPRYQPGHHGIDEEPTALQEAKDAADTPDGKIDASLQLKVLLETEDWQIVVDERAGSRRLYINSKSLGQDFEGSGFMIEFDREQGVLGLVAPGGIALRSPGLIDIRGTTVQINGRKILQGLDNPT